MSKSGNNRFVTGIYRLLCSGLVAAATGLFLSGCGHDADPAKHHGNADHDHDHAHDGEHGHDHDHDGDRGHAKENKEPEGHTHVAPHGGQVQAVGESHYELTFDAESHKFTLYLLGDDDFKGAAIGEQELTLQVQAAGSDEFTSVTLQADPQQGDADGMTSRFSGVLAEEKSLGSFSAVARVPIDGESHRISFEMAGGGGEPK